MSVPNPFLVLEIPEDADDAAIRSAYLELVRRYPPESHPEQFQAVADAYEMIKLADKRAKFLLFGSVPPVGGPLRVLVPPSPNHRHPVGIERWLQLLAEAHHGH